MTRRYSAHRDRGEVAFAVANHLLRMPDGYGDGERFWNQGFHSRVRDQEELRLPTSRNPLLHWPFANAGGGTRTPDTRIMIPLL